MKKFIAPLLALFLTACGSPKGQITIASWGCKDIESTHQLFAASMADATIFNNYVNKFKSSGECVPLMAGEVVTLKEEKTPYRLINSNGQDLWIVGAFVKP